MGAEVLRGCGGVWQWRRAYPSGLSGWGPQAVKVGLARGLPPHWQLLSDDKCPPPWAPTSLVLLAELMSRGCIWIC